MDSRRALEKNTRLRFGDGYEYIITEELARGGSSIVCNAFYPDNPGERKTVRIKKCIFFKHNLKSQASGELFIPTEEELFKASGKKMLKAYSWEQMK